jgi:trans-aconitate methyltransferase
MNDSSDEPPLDDLHAPNDGYSLARSEREYRRLSVQGRIWERATRAALDRVSLRYGARVLDAGCGPGDAMRLLAERVGDRGRVTGLDVDPNLAKSMLPLLRTERPEVYRFICGDLLHLNSIKGAPFDLVFARLLLFHVTQPLDALRRLWEWVRPGGMLLVLDYDLTGARSCPQHPTIERALRLVNAAFRRNGRDIEIGTRMPELFVDAGIGTPDACEVNSVIIAGPTSTTMLSEVVMSLRSTILRARLADSATLDRIDSELTQAQFAGNFMRWPDLIATWKRKPQ